VPGVAEKSTPWPDVPTTKLPVVAVTVVNRPVSAVVAPTETLFIVLAVVGLIVTVPVPVGLIATAALAGVMLVATERVILSPPPAPKESCVVPLEFLSVNPPEFVACTAAVVRLVAAISRPAVKLATDTCLVVLL